MRIVITGLGLILFAGCGSYVPLEQLEADAIRTGDWSLVEKRERSIARRNSHSTVSCPPGFTGFCELRGLSEKCACVDSDDIHASLDDWED